MRLIDSRGIELFKEYQIIGHRGASAYAPENTMSAFKQAQALGCSFVEFDVMLSADGEALVFHDETLKRTTNGRGKFGLVTAEYLQTLDAGKWFSKYYKGEHIPLLRDVLEWMAGTNVQANIEIKPYPGFTEPTAIAVLTHISRFWPQGKTLPLVSSFDLDALRICRSMSPELPIGLLLSEWQENWLQLADEQQCFSVHLSLKDATQARIHEIKKHGYAVCIYTVNRKRKAAKLFGWGVDAVFSDYPDLLI